jgi:hypothetical protein
MTTSQLFTKSGKNWRFRFRYKFEFWIPAVEILNFYDLGRHLLHTCTCKIPSTINKSAYGHRGDHNNISSNNYFRGLNSFYAYTGEKKISSLRSYKESKSTLKNFLRHNSSSFFSLLTALKSCFSDRMTLNLKPGPKTGKSFALPKGQTKLSFTIQQRDRQDSRCRCSTFIKMVN